MTKTADVVNAWFTARGWKPFEFQQLIWAACARGESGLLHATTGAGKTYAVWFGAIYWYIYNVACERNIPASNSDLLSVSTKARNNKTPAKTPAEPLTVLWLTPMRALAADTLRALQVPIDELKLPWTVGLRTGDTTSSERARQDKRFPTALVTTPESLSLMLSRANAREELARVQMVVVDEWHEMIGNKRGVQVQLAIARLKAINPKLMVWGLSATLGNLDEAMAVLLGKHDKEEAPSPQPSPADAGEGAKSGQLVQGKLIKTLTVDTLIPKAVGRFPWGGHLGIQMLQPVVDEIESSASTLVFTNTRSQAEIWYQQLLAARPDWAGVIALHHGSLDKAVREWVEAGLKDGSLKAVVATSSLDLGVDFASVERVLQIGSAKGVARLLQRAGRSGHSPGRPSRITLVPTHALELIEAAAARQAVLAGRIEKREPPDKPMDVLVQHLVTAALGGGFTADAMYEEVKQAYSYQHLSRDEFQWALDFVQRGGSSLTAYPEFHRAVPGEDGVWHVPDRGVARRHRLNIGTIVSDASMNVSYMNGGRIGSVEEGFIARLRKGDCFLFAGRLLEYIRTQDMTAYVKKAEKHKGAVPRWQGGKMPLSNEMSDAVLGILQRADQGDFFEPELLATQDLLALQKRVSALPTPQNLLLEAWQSKEGHHLYLYPFAGRHVHMGLASLLAYRLARERPNTFSISMNDYGFELLSAEPVDTKALLDGSVFSGKGLLPDILASLNSSELAQRRFREVARVSGLIQGGYPGAPRSNKQLQASSSLFFEVFRQYDANNQLLAQAQTEVLSQELELQRLRDTLEKLRKRELKYIELKKPSPFSFPLLIERLREKLSTEKLSDRIARMLKEMEAGV
jgi:ATP-dependent helicase Lhr and Lhr-like helicase